MRPLSSGQYIDQVWTSKAHQDVVVASKNMAEDNMLMLSLRDALVVMGLHGLCLFLYLINKYYVNRSSAIGRYIGQQSLDRAE